MLCHEGPTDAAGLADCCKVSPMQLTWLGNLLSQGVAMANFRKLVFTGRLWKLALTGRRHGQFSEFGVHRASP